MLACATESGLKNASPHYLEKAILFVALLIPLWSVGPFSTYDGPQHVLAGYLLNHLGDPGTPFARYLELQPSLSALFCPIVVALFEKLLPIRVALKCTLSVIFLLQATGYLRLLTAAGAGQSSLRWVAPILPYTFVFYMGFHNYSAALGFGFWSLATILTLGGTVRQGSPPSLSALLRLSGLLLLTALSHAFAAALLGLLGGLWLVVTVGVRKIPQTLAWLFIASLPALAILVAVMLTAAQQQHTPVSSVLSFDIDRLLWLPRNMYETPYGIVWVANAIVGLAGVGLLWNVVRRRRAVVGPLVVSTVIVFMVLCLPNDVQSWQGLPVRFTPWLSVTLLVGAGLDWPTHKTKSALAMSAIMGGLVFASLVSVTDANSRLADLQTEFEAGIGEVDDVGPRRQIYRPGSSIEAPGDSYMAANLHVYYMIDEGAVFPLVFANRSEQHILSHTENWQEFARSAINSRSLPQSLRWQLGARQGLSLDEVMLWAPEPERLAVFEDVGYETAFSHERLVRLLPPGRSLVIEVEADQTRRLFATAVFSDLLWPYGRVALLPNAGAPGRLTGTMSDMPASMVFIEIFEWAANENHRSLMTEMVDLSEANGQLFIDLRIHTDH